MKEVITAFVIAIFVGALINGFASAGSAPTAATTTETPAAAEAPTSSSSSVSSVAETTDSTFDNDVLKAKTPVLVDFYATWCGPCKQMAPVVEQIAGKYGDKLKVVRLDVDQNAAVTAKYSVNTLPTFIVFKDGKRGESYTGVVPEEILAETVDKALK